MYEMEYLLNEKTNVTTVTINRKTLRNLLKQLPNSNKGELAKIEAYVCLTAAVLALIVIMGSMRRLCGHQKFFRLCIWFASTISYGLISYTMGLMTAATFNHQLFAIWAVFLLVILGRADSLIAYSVVDNEKRTWYVSKVVLQMFWAGWLIGLYVHERIFQLPLWCLWLISAVRIYEKLKANQYVGKKLRAENGVKLVADFMSYEDHLGTEEEQNHYDPRSMKGYRYLVYEKGGVIKGMEDHHRRLKMEKVITTEKIWQCTGRLLKPDQDPEGKLKDVCLSFALYKLLLRRFAGFPLHEAHLEKTRAFVRDGLLQKEKGDDPYRRVRMVIGVELGFLYEFFYTKYPVIFAGGFPVYKIIELLIVLIGLAFAASNLEHYISAEQENLIVFGINVDLFITRGMISVIVIMELFQFLSNLLSNWNKVKLLVSYIKKSSRQDCMVMEWMIKCLFRIAAPFQFARHINQYSFLQSFDYNPPTVFLNSFLSKFINVRRKGQRVHRIKHPEEATIEILDFLSLVLSDGARKLTNGAGSLIRNSTREQGYVDHELVLELLKQCAFETHIRGIMVWHIATCLCEYEYEYRKHERSPCETLKRNFTVASCLSNYCAYLAAFVPDLLPDYVEVTRRTFHRTVKQARSVLGRRKTMDVKFEKMMDENFGTEAGHDNIVKGGANLGRLLLQNVRDRTLLWKVLAEFWVEKILFLTPSNNATAHAEHLAKGGEFITYIWAVLNHAGIVEPNSPMANSPIEIPIQCDEIPIEII